MLNKFIALVMSFLIPLTTFASNAINGALDAVTENLFGIPYSINAVKDDFFRDIDDSDVVPTSKNLGYINDKIMVFINPDASFMDKLNFFNSSGGKLVGWNTAIDLYVIDFDELPYKAIEAKCNLFSGNEFVELALPVNAYKASQNGTPSDDFEYPDVVSEWDELNPEGRNWHLEAINARQAWDYSDYMSKIDIGILDAGFDVDHPELEGKIYFPSYLAAYRNSQNSHGCHVAGIIGARHNGFGIAGVCDNSDLICYDWYPDGLQIWNTDLALFFGFSNLVKAGSKVVNISAGMVFEDLAEAESLLYGVIQPMAYSYMMASLLAKGYDFLAVQAAGNDAIFAKYAGMYSSINEDNVFTGAYKVTAQDIIDRIVTVASAENSFAGEYTLSSFSNYGSRVDIVAPGSDIYSCSYDGGYEYMSGTSMAAPVVTGVASLVWSVNPDFSGAEVKEIICNATDKKVSLNPFNEYLDDITEYNLVNAKLSVEEAIKRTDSSVGTVKGKIIGNAHEIVCNGSSFTVYSDGTYSFITSDGNAEIEVLDINGDEIGSFNVDVKAGETTDAGEYNIIGEDINKPATETDAVRN